MLSLHTINNSYKLMAKKNLYSKCNKHLRSLWGGIVFLQCRVEQHNWNEVISIQRIWVSMKNGNNILSTIYFQTQHVQSLFTKLPFLHTYTHIFILYSIISWWWWSPQLQIEGDIYFGFLATSCLWLFCSSLARDSYTSVYFLVYFNPGFPLNMANVKK